MKAQYEVGERDAREIVDESWPLPAINCSKQALELGLAPNALFTRAAMALRQRIVEGSTHLELNLENSRLTDVEVTRFCKSTKRLMTKCKGKFEVRLNCSQNWLSSHGLATLLRFVAQMPNASLVKLKAFANRIEALPAELFQLRGLQELHLSHNLLERQHLEDLVTWASQVQHGGRDLYPMQNSQPLWLRFEHNAGHVAFESGLVWRRLLDERRVCVVNGTGGCTPQCCRAGRRTAPALHVAYLSDRKSSTSPPASRSNSPERHRSQRQTFLIRPAVRRAGTRGLLRPRASGPISARRRAPKSLTSPSSQLPSQLRCPGQLPRQLLRQLLRLLLRQTRARSPWS